MNDYTEILVDVAEAIAVITLNRPDKLNAWTPTMEAELKGAITMHGADLAVRAIVITGAGRGFCAGADMGTLQAASRGERLTEPRSANSNEDFGQRLTYLLQVPKPVIAAINGPAAGIGFSLSMFCDFRYMADGGCLVPVFSRRGLIAEHGVAWILPRLVGTMEALDLLMSGRSIDADEAQRLGLARKMTGDDFLSSVRAAALGLIERASPRSIGVIKRQVYQGWMHGLADAVKDSEREQALSLQTEDFVEGVAHFLERRPPEFSGR